MSGVVPHHDHDLFVIIAADDQLLIVFAFG